MSKIKDQNYNKGKGGEQIALEYLENKGFELVEANYENKLGEIDLVMTEGECLVFVEVKFKSDDAKGKPEEMIGSGKLKQIRRVAESYLMLNPEMRKRFEKYRIDAVCILGEEIRYYRNLF